MDKLIGMAAVGGATVFSILVALLLEGALLKVILGSVAKAKMNDDAAGEPAPEGAYRNLRTVAH
jgi:hypothetical protein